ncbi:antitoxin MazE family protein [soil metagenome]
MSDGAKRVRKHREKMKAAGLKPVTVWVPDVHTPEFKARVARAIALINASEGEKEILEELGIDFDGWK